MRQEFIEFYSPGTFFSETTRRPTNCRSVDLARDMAREIRERYGSTPYGFCFVARERADGDLDAHDTDRSAFFYLGGVVETLEEVKARAGDGDRVLIRNMECNGWDRIVTNDNSWNIVLPLMEGDVVLEWTP